MNRDIGNTSYYVTETARGTFAVVERTSITQSGSHRSEEIVGEYDFRRDADAHADWSSDLLWSKRA